MDRDTSFRTGLVNVNGEGQAIMRVDNWTDLTVDQIKSGSKYRPRLAFQSSSLDISSQEGVLVYCWLTLFLLQRSHSFQENIYRWSIYPGCRQVTIRMRLVDNSTPPTWVFFYDGDDGWRKTLLIGVWSAYWMTADNWPHGGEIDIIENVHNSLSNQVSWHTDPCLWLLLPLAAHSWSIFFCLFQHKPLTDWRTWLTYRVQPNESG
jgi:hypothetical protein